MRLPIDESKIPDEDKNPTVLLLFEIIRQQAEQIQQLKDEIARLNPSSCSQKLSCMISICYPFKKRDFDTTDSNKLYNIVFTILPG